MNKFFKPLIIMAAGLVLMSCNNNTDDANYYRYKEYVTLDTWSGFYSFTADNGKTYYPGDTSRIGTYPTIDDEGNSKNGRRVFIYYNILPEKEEGYDYNLDMYGIIDILSKTVEVAETAEQVAAAGDDRLAIEAMNLSGGWLDVAFYVMTHKGATHKLTLLDNQTVQAPSSMPSGYQYLEFRQLAEVSGSTDLGLGYVSFNLGSYRPSADGIKGLYIRIKNLYGNDEFLTVAYKATREGGSSFQVEPTFYQGWLR